MLTDCDRNNSHRVDLLAPDLLASFGLDLNLQMDDQPIRNAVRMILESVGEDPDRDGLRSTPDRVTRMYKEVLEGYWVNPEKLINNALFDVDYKEMITVKNIEFCSMCEHHLLPFVGRANVAYIPGNKIIGLSKISRVVDMFAHRLQIQERMTHQIADFLVEVLHPVGVAVLIEGIHMCTMMRGVKKTDSHMVTAVMVGAFKDDEKTRAEFLENVGRTTWQIF